MTKDLRTHNHNELVRKVLLHLHTFGGRYWQNEVATLKTEYGYRKIGLHGSADILGLTSQGIFVAVEVKTGKAVLAPSQLAFRDMIIKNGGIHIVAREDYGSKITEVRP